MLDKYYASSKTNFQIKRKRNHYKAIFKEAKQSHINYYQSDHTFQKFKQGSGAYRNKSHHISTNRMASQDREQRINRKTQHISSAFGNQNLREEFSIYKKDNKNLISKLEQIEKINKETKLKRVTRKKVQQSAKKQTEFQWKKYLKKLKVSMSTYECITKMKQQKKSEYQKKKREQQVFANINIQNDIDDKHMKDIQKYKTGQICSFLLGFPDNKMKEQIEQLTQSTSLSKLQKYLKKSQGIKHIYDKLAKNKLFQNFTQQDLDSNFVSAVFANQFVKKNGTFNSKVPNILKKSYCML